MTTTRHKTTVQLVVRRFARLGTRTLAGMAAALTAALLLLASPEIGIAGAIGGVVVGGVSAVLIRPHNVG